MKVINVQNLLFLCDLQFKFNSVTFHIFDNTSTRTFKKYNRIDKKE